MKKAIKLPEGTRIYNTETSQEYIVVRRSGLDHIITDAAGSVTSILNQNRLKKNFKELKK